MTPTLFIVILKYMTLCSKHLLFNLANVAQAFSSYYMNRLITVQQTISSLQKEGHLIVLKKIFFWNYMDTILLMF